MTPRQSLPPTSDALTQKVYSTKAAGRAFWVWVPIQTRIFFTVGLRNILKATLSFQHAWAQTQDFYKLEVLQLMNKVDLI